MPTLNNLPWTKPLRPFKGSTGSIPGALWGRTGFDDDSWPPGLLGSQLPAPPRLGLVEPLMAGAGGSVSSNRGSSEYLKAQNGPKALDNMVFGPKNLEIRVLRALRFSIGGPLNSVTRIRALLLGSMLGGTCDGAEL